MFAVFVCASLLCCRDCVGFHFAANIAVTQWRNCIFVCVSFYISVVDELEEENENEETGSDLNYVIWDPINWFCL